jgi:gingipain R
MVFLFLVLLLPVLALGEERVILTQASEDVSVTVLESNDTRTVLRFDVGGFSKELVNIGGQAYYAVWCGKDGVLLNAGEPALPRICRSIIIPDDAEMELQVLSSEYRDYPMTQVIPSKGNLPRTVNPADIPYSFGPVYQEAQWYPEKLASLREPHILRDLRGTVVELNAFRYHTGLELLRVYTSVTVEVYAAGSGQVNILQRPEPLTHVNSDFGTIYQRHFVNYGTFDSRYAPIDEAGEMLIITYDSFHSTMQPLVDWKIQKGIKTTIVDVSTIGNNSTAIDNYIQTFYNNSGGNLAWVLLVGDAAQVATPSGGADPTYAKVVGTDNYPDIFIGRFSAETVAHVQTQVERTVEYERDAQVGAAWYHQGTGIGSDQGPGHNGGEYDYQHENNIRTDLLAFTYTLVDQIYDPGATAAQVSTALNAGRSIVNYTGHGDVTLWGTTGFSNTNVNALVNDNKLPFIISVACYNGSFTSATCFGEAWLRATHSGEPIGAIGAYMSSISQSWNPPMDAQDEAVDLLCAESKTTFGGICFNGSCKMIDINGSSGATEFNAWHIFGDPSVLLRTDTPVAMDVTHPGNIAPGAPDFAVTVVGVSGALCALSYNGTLFGAAYTDGSGLATIPVEGTLPDGENIKLTITAFNKLTYTADILVDMSGPDTYPPNISFTPFGDTMDEVGPYVMNATITDYSGVQGATFYYGFNGVNFTPLAMVNTSGNTWTASFGGFPAGTTVYYYMTATDASENHNMRTTATNDFSVFGVIFSDDMESGEGSWTHSALVSGWTDQWHLSTEMNHSSSHAWKFGDTGTSTYANHAYGGLVSPPIAITSVATLTFWHWIQAEVSGAYSDSAYDAGVVDISVDGGAWTQLTTLNPTYNKWTRCTAGSGNPYTGPFSCRTPCYSGDIGWTQVSTSLDSYAGHTVQIRFRFGSDNGTGREGWYMDDFMVIGIPSGPPDPVTDLVIGTDGSNVTLSWTSTGAASYNIYSDTDPFGSFTTLEGNTASNSFSLPIGSDVRFFIVKSSN